MPQRKASARESVRTEGLKATKCLHVCSARCVQLNIPFGAVFVLLIGFKSLLAGQRASLKWRRFGLRYASLDAQNCTKGINLFPKCLTLQQDLKVASSRIKMWKEASHIKGKRSGSVEAQAYSVCHRSAGAQFV